VVDASTARTSAPASADADCRAAANPSFPAIAAWGEKSVVAYYDGPRVVVAGGSAALEAERPMPVGEVPTAGPALAAGPDGAVLLTVVAAGAGYRLDSRHVAADLSELGRAVPLAPGVDARYTPALVAAGDGFLVGWIDVSSGVGRAMAGRLRADGRPAAAPQGLSPEASNAGAIALSKGPSGVVAAWIDPRLGFSPLYVSAGGTRGEFGPAEVALTTGSVSSTPFVAVAGGEDGDALLAWGHMGPLGQDYLSRALRHPGAPPPPPTPLSRADAYATLHAALLREGNGWVALWDEPTGTGRRPPTAVRLQRLDRSGAPRGGATTLAPGGGVAAIRDGDSIRVAVRRGSSICALVLDRGGQ
jgi:hypothetical protein